MTYVFVMSPEVSVTEEDIRRWSDDLERAVDAATGAVAKLDAWRRWTKEVHDRTWTPSLANPGVDEMVRLMESEAWGCLQQVHNRVFHSVFGLFTPYRRYEWKLLHTREEWELHKIVVNLPYPDIGPAMHRDVEDHHGEPESFPCLVRSEEQSCEGDDNFWQHIFVHPRDAWLLVGKPPE